MGKNGTGLFFELCSNVTSCIIENSLRIKSKKAVRSSKIYKIGCRGNSKQNKTMFIWAEWNK